MNGFNGYANAQGYNTGMGMMQPMSYVQQGRVMQPLMNNPLTAEEEKLLKAEQDTFDLKVDAKEIAEAVCTHKKDGRFKIASMNDGTGNCYCELCKQIFNPDVVTEMYVKESVDHIVNTLQTCKMIAVDMNNDVVRQYFTIIPYITRIPKLYSMLARIFNKYHLQNPVQAASGPNVFGMFNSIMNPATPLMQPMADPYQYNYAMANMQNNMVMGGSPLYQQPPMYQQQPQQPMMNNMGQPVYPQQQAPMYQQQVQQPMMNGMVQQPMNQPQMPNQQVQQPNTQQTQPTQQNTQGQPQQVQVKEQLQL